MAATSARSWVRVRGSSGPCSARAAAVVRSQIPAAVSAGRYAVEPGHPVAVRDELDPPVRRALGVALFDADRVVAFPPRARLGAEPARDEVPGRAPAGRVRRAGVQEVRLQRRRPGRIQAGGFVHHDPGVLPRERPGLQGLQGQRQRCRQRHGSRPAAPRRSVRSRSGHRRPQRPPPSPGAVSPDGGLPAFSARPPSAERDSLKMRDPPHPSRRINGASRPRASHYPTKRSPVLLVLCINFDRFDHPTPAD